MASFPTQFGVYWFDPNPTKGAEIRKVRPCIVISPNEMNQYLKTVIVVPLTSTIIDWPFRITLSILGHRSSAACDQMRAVDISRLRAQIETLHPLDRQKLTSVLQTMFAN